MTRAMQAVARAWRKVWAATRRDTAARDLDEEMRFHRELLARDLETEGMSPRDAEGAARRQFGNSTALRERAADAWSFPLLDDLAQDVRFGVRLLRRSPMFSLVAVVAIGLAIGINTGFFTLVDAFVWRPIPVPRPDGIVRLALTFSRGGSGILWSYPQVRDLTRHSKTLDQVLPLGRCPLVAFRATPSRTAEPATPVCVSGNFFGALGGSAAVGRALLPADDQNDAPAAIVISDRFWTRAFSRAPDIVGRDVIINGAHATVAGVIRDDFIGLVPLIPDFWITIPAASRLGMTPGTLSDPTNRFIDMRARLKPGITPSQSAAEISGMVAEPPRSGAGADASRITGAAVRANDTMIEMSWQTALVLAPALIVAALVLVIACANLANLLLSRALARQREIAVRLALGASRGRLLRQLLTESLVISLLGSVLGFALAAFTVTAVSRAFFADIPAAFGAIVLDLRPSWRVAAYTVGLGIVSVLSSGLAPALQVTSSSVTASLKGEDTVFGTRLRRSRFRDMLVAIEVAGCLVLLVAAGMLMASTRTFGTQASGFEPERVAFATFGLAATGRIPPALDSARAVFASRVLRVPVVTASARALRPPFGFSWPQLSAAATNQAEYRHIQFNVVTPRYFEVIGQRLSSGRAFTADDSASDAHVAIVSAAAARTFWPTTPALGQMLRVAQGADEPDKLYRIVGVATEAHAGMVWDFDDNGYVYLPATAHDFATYDMPVLVRSDAPASVLDRALKDVARAVDPNSPIQVQSVIAARDAMLTPLRYGAWITNAVVAFGLGLALIGLYGVVAFAVAQRRQEIAVRVALGAGSRDVLRLVLRREMRLVVFGVAVGLVLAVGETKLVEAWIVPLTPLGAGGFAGLAALLFAVAALASLIPALGALRIAPMQVLRQD